MAAAARVSFDFVIVGAGSAGSVLAKRLSQGGRHSVLLIEAGKSDRYLPVHVPVGYLHCIGNPRTDWRFQTEKESGLGGRSLAYPRGKVLGGSSSINGMIYMRGQVGDYATWASVTGDSGWSWDSLLPLFKRDEDHHGGATEFHGQDGVWRVEKQRLKWKALEVFKSACVESGIPEVADFNRGNNFGVSYFDVTQRGGWRLNAFQAFVRPQLGSSTVRLQSDTLVKQLLFALDDPKRCVGVELHNGARVEAKREVILAAGAIGSVQILERSGVGCARRLEKIPGITVRHNLPGVGENLQDHLQLRASFQVSGLSTLNSRANSMLGKLGIGLEYALNRSGPLSMAPSQLGVFACSSPAHSPNRPNVEFHVQPLSLDRFGEPLHSYDAITASVCNLRPTSRGSVHIVSAEPSAEPSIRPGYLKTEGDLQVASDSIRLARKIVLQSKAFAPFSPREVKPGNHLFSEQDLRKAAGDIGTTIFHPVGTCKMGPASDPLSVVSPQLLVHGLRGLRVVDASIMPTITSGNTAAPTMVIAERASDMILHSHSLNL